MTWEVKDEPTALSFGNVTLYIGRLDSKLEAKVCLGGRNAKLVLELNDFAHAWAVQLVKQNPLRLCLWSFKLRRFSTKARRSELVPKLGNFDGVHALSDKMLCHRNERLTLVSATSPNRMIIGEVEKPIVRSESVSKL